MSISMMICVLSRPGSSIDLESWVNPLHRFVICTRIQWTFSCVLPSFCWFVRHLVTIAVAQSSRLPLPLDSPPWKLKKQCFYRTATRNFNIVTSFRPIGIVICSSCFATLCPLVDTALFRDLLSTVYWLKACIPLVVCGVLLLYAMCPYSQYVHSFSNLYPLPKVLFPFAKHLHHS